MSEMSVSFYQATQRHISAVIVLHKHYCENFASVFFFFFFCLKSDDDSILYISETRSRLLSLGKILL